MVFDADVHGRRQRDDGRLLRQHGEHSPDRVPDGDDGRALIAVRFDAQYSAGLDDRMKQQITETVQKVDDNLKDVEITDDDTLYGQIKGLGERVANVTGLDELADDFGDLWDRIVGR